MPKKQDHKQTRERCVSPLPETNRDLKNLRKQFGTAEREALRASWTQLKGTLGTKGIATLMYQVIEKTLDLEPTSNYLFFKAAFPDHESRSESRELSTMYEHAKMLGNYLEKLVLFINEVPLSTPLREPRIMGENHTRLLSFGFGSNQCIQFRDTLLETVWGQRCVREYPCAYKAWKMVICSLMKQFRFGFECKLQRTGENDHNRKESGEKDCAEEPSPSKDSLVVRGGMKNVLSMSLAISYNNMVTSRSPSPPALPRTYSFNDVSRHRKLSSEESRQYFTSNYLLPSPQDGTVSPDKRDWRSSHNLSLF